MKADTACSRLPFLQKILKWEDATFKINRGHSGFQKQALRLTRRIYRLGI